MTAIPVFELKDTNGLPFDLIGVMLKEKDAVPDWQDFMRQAIAHRWTPERIWKEAEELATPLGFWTVPVFQERLKMIFTVEMKRFLNTIILGILTLCVN